MNRYRFVFFAALALSFQSVSYADRASELVESLREDDEGVALVAEEQLLKMGADAVRPLQKVLDDANFKVRRRAAETLGRMGPAAKRAAPDLVLRLGDAQVEVHTAAENALLSIGEDAIPALSNALQSDQEGLRKMALSTLARCGPKAIPIVAARLKKDQNVFIRASAAEALGQSRPAIPESIAALVQGLSDLEEGVRGAAVDALGSLGAESKEAIGPLFKVSQEDREALVRKKATDALIQIGTADKELGVQVAALFIPLVTKGTTQGRLGAIRLLGHFGPAGVPGLIQALSDRDDEVSREAGEALILIGPEAIPALEELQKSSYPYVKRRASDILRHMQPKKARRTKK